CDLDDDAARVGARFAVTRGIATLTFPDVRRLAGDASRTLHRQPPATVDLADGRVPAALGVEDLLRTLERDDAYQSSVGVPRETDRDDMGCAVLAERRQSRQMVFGQELEGFAAHGLGCACHDCRLGQRTR